MFPAWKPLRRMTEMRMFDPAVFTGVFYAHRGLYNNHAGVPENSLPAFRAAGYTMFRYDFTDR